MSDQKVTDQNLSDRVFKSFSRRLSILIKKNKKEFVEKITFRSIASEIQLDLAVISEY